jgi:hypothetical protein
MQLLVAGIALLGQVVNGRRPAEYLLGVAAGEEREGLVRRAALVTRRGELGEPAMLGVELAVQRPHPGLGRLGGGFRPAEHLQLTAVLFGQLGRPGLGGQQGAGHRHGRNPTPGAQSAAKPAS